VFVGVEKMSVSFDLELGAAIRSSAAGEGRSVSAWLAEAARDRLRLAALGDAVAAWEEQFGPLTDAEVADAARLLDQPPAKAPARKTRSPRRRGAA
jgi:hypothetical protein